MPQHGLTKRCLTSGAGQQQVQHGRTSCSATTSAGQSGLHAVSRGGAVFSFLGSKPAWVVCCTIGMPRTLTRFAPHLRSHSARAAMRSSRRRDTSHSPHALSVTTRSCSTVALRDRAQLRAMKAQRRWRQAAAGGGRW